MARRKPHTQAFWDALVRRGITPEQAAPHIPELSEFEIAAEMVKARVRVDDEAKEDVIRAQIFAGTPMEFRDRGSWMRPARREPRTR